MAIAYAKRNRNARTTFGFGLFVCLFDSVGSSTERARDRERGRTAQKCTCICSYVRGGNTVLLDARARARANRDSLHICVLLGVVLPVEQREFIEHIRSVSVWQTERNSVWTRVSHQSQKNHFPEHRLCLSMANTYLFGSLLLIPSKSPMSAMSAAAAAVVRSAS